MNQGINGGLTQGFVLWRVVPAKQVRSQGQTFCTGGAIRGPAAQLPQHLPVVTGHKGMTRQIALKKIPKSGKTVRRKVC